MGREKLSLEVNGLSMIERVYEALAGTCREVLVVGGEGQGPATVRYVADQRPGRQGPLAGIEAGLGASNYEQVFVAAGDMPFLTEDLANHLLDLLERNHVPAVIPRFGTRTHPLCGAYARALLPRVSSALDGGIRAVREFLQNLDGVVYVGEELRRFGDPKVLLMSVNSPEDLERARREAAR